MTCAELREHAPDLALGLAQGSERAEAIQHLESCARCRALVDELSRAADDMLLLAPGAEPRRGFESMVLSRLTESGSGGGSGAAPVAPVAVGPATISVGSSRWGRRPVVAFMAGVAAAALVALLVIVGVLVVGARSSSPTRPDLTTAAMLTPDGREVGEVHVLDREPPLVLLSVPGWGAWLDRVGAAGEYRLRVEAVDGRPTELELLSLSAGRDVWSGAVAVDRDRVTRIAVVDELGREWCGATLPERA